MLLIKSVSHHASSIATTHSNLHSHVHFKTCRSGNCLNTSMGDHIRSYASQAEMDSKYLQILDNLLKLPINDLTCINVAVQHFQLLTGQPVWGPLGVIKAVCKFGLHTNNRNLLWDNKHYERIPRV